MARPNQFESARSFVSKSGMPVTIATIILAAVAFVVLWATKDGDVIRQTIFFSDSWFARPWTLVTYALVEIDFIRFVFSALMAFFFMGALERAWTRERFLPSYIVFLTVPPLTLWLGGLAAGVVVSAHGLWLPVAAWTVAFGAYRPQATILVFGIVPVKAMFIAWFAGLAAVFEHGAAAPVAGIGVGLSMVLAWLMGSNRLSLSLPKRQQSSGDEFRKSMKTKREAEQERLRLRELLERSVQDDDAE